MENASKALIIAGAILLSILIIGLGMLIFNQAKDAMSNTGMDKQKIDAYNSEFEAYVGTNVNGTRVRSLIDTIRTHNISTQDDETLEIKLTVQNNGNGNITQKSAANDLNNAKTNIKAGKTYSVSVNYDSTTGYINLVTIDGSAKGTQSGGTQSGGTQSGGTQSGGSSN